MEDSMNITRTTCAAVSAAALMALAACSGGSTGSTAGPKDVSIATSVPAPKGDVDSITWNLPAGEPNTLDPAQSALDSISTLDANLCEQLATFGTDYKLQPSLAEKISEPDDKTFVFDLRPGVTFWDGSPMTADDVVYSMDRVRDEKVASAWASSFDGVTSIEKTGPMQVTVKFDKPNVLFKWYQATPAMSIVSKAATEKLGKKFGTASGGIMCTGPYKIEKWRSGQDITLVRNDSYWGAKPKVAKARFTFDTDTSSATSALLRGDVDGQWTNAVSSQTKLAKSGSGKMLYGQSLSPVFLTTFTQDPAVKNPDIRKALSMTVDVQGIAKSVYGGAAKPIKKLTSPATWGYSKPIFQAAYDKLPEPKQNLAEAKKLVEAAGSVPPLTFAYDNGSAEDSKVALSMQASAKQIGLDIKLRSLSSTDYNKIFSDEQAREGLSGYIVRGYLDFPEPLSYDLYATQGSYYNYVGYDNPEYDKLLAEATATVDDDARATLVTQAEALRSNDHYVVPIVTPYIDVFVNKRLTGLVPSQSFLYTPWLASIGSSK
jgi:peptide/nickel transport system substrate-binding protein